MVAEDRQVRLKQAIGECSPVIEDAKGETRHGSGR